MHLTSRVWFDYVNITRGQFDWGFNSKGLIVLGCFFSGGRYNGGRFGKRSNSL